jgi:argininosuccinate lyase
VTERVALAYSGGLDTSVAARTLRDERGLDVVAAFVDVGQPYARDELEARASAAGAELRVIDARQAFAEGFCLPALFANALYEGKYPLVSALARPLIAAEVVRVAHRVGAAYVAHGCTGKGNDQVRFEASFAALAPDLTAIAPVREAALSREEALERAREWSIPVSAEVKTYSVDENLWGRTVECGPLEDPWVEPPGDAFRLTADPRLAPDAPAEVTVAFEAGRPEAVDGDELELPDVVARLNAIGGAHGFGRVDMIENRLVGIKSRELYEVPGALALVLAHRDLEDLTLERDLAHEKVGLERRWAELCYYGQWYGPLHAALRAFMRETQGDVTGEVRLRFFRGSCTVVGRRSPRALYDLSLATYERGADRFDHHQSAGFVALWSLPIRVWAARRDLGAVEDRGPAATTPPIGEPISAEGSPQAASEPTEQPVPAPAEPPVAPVWSGRFAEAPAEGAMDFTRSLAFDRRLLAHDLRATASHVDTLARAGLLAPEERDLLALELDRLLKEAVAGTFPFHAEDEDVHVAVERVLTERLGPVGRKVHAGRSRNDLVATDLRLWVKEAARDLAREARDLASVLADRAEGEAETLMPGYTHLQRAQPVTLAHHLLAHAFPLVRDAQRLERAAAAADVSPLGAGALATSTLPLDPAGTARSLGFGSAFDNSMDAVADRDFALEFLAGCLTTAVHLSRLGEDLVLWSSEEFGFARPHDAYATGSSMMPQKRNPDVAELARAKAGRVLGDLVTLATVMKGLPMAYDRDLQEDKEAVFDAYDALRPALSAMAGMVATMQFDRERMAEAAGGFLLATDLAEHLVSAGVPFREAHEAVGRAVADLDSKGRSLADVQPEEWAELLPGLSSAAVALLSPERAVARRGIPGGPSPESVRHQVATLRARLMSG